MLFLLLGTVSVCLNNKQLAPSKKERRAGLGRSLGGKNVHLAIIHTHAKLNAVTHICNENPPRLMGQGA